MGLMIYVVVIVIAGAVGQALDIVVTADVLDESCQSNLLRLPNPYIVGRVNITVVYFLINLMTDGLLVSFTFIL